MREKKQFFIPKNYDKKFEWIPGISGWQHLAFVPVVFMDYYILVHAPFAFSNKATIIAVSLAIPWLLMGTHPVRENVPLYKHLMWRINFLRRQRQFKYRKEGYIYAEYLEERSKADDETTGTGKKVDSESNTDQGNTPGAADNAGKQNGDVLKGLSYQFRTDK